MPSCVRLVNLINETVMKTDHELSEHYQQFESVLTSENCASSANQFQKFDSYLCMQSSPSWLNSKHEKDLDVSWLTYSCSLM